MGPLRSCPPNAQGDAGAGCRPRLWTAAAAAGGGAAGGGGGGGAIPAPGVSPACINGAASARAMLLWMARRSTAAGSWLDFWPFAGAARCTAFPLALTASCWLRETFGGLGGCTPAGSRRGARTLRCACSTSLDRWHYCTYRSSSERVSDCAWLHTTNSTRPPHEVSQSTAAVHASAGTPQCRRRRLPVPHLSRAQTPAFLVYSTPQPKTCRQWGAFAPEQKEKAASVKRRGAPAPHGEPSWQLPGGPWRARTRRARVAQPSSPT